ncbi:MAG: hypothetical protein M1826_000804 [Phylliscum demangeonii]|nr:MAG: hypothetical protein M1826_000804 [Phylliscum demangeonii]
MAGATCPSYLARQSLKYLDLMYLDPVGQAATASPAPSPTSWTPSVPSAGLFPELEPELTTLFEVKVRDLLTNANATMAADANAPGSTSFDLMTVDPSSPVRIPNPAAANLTCAGFGHGVATTDLGPTTTEPFISGSPSHFMQPTGNMNEHNQPVFPATHPMPMQGLNEHNQPVFPATHPVPMQGMNERNQPVFPATHPVPMQGMNERNQPVFPAPHPIPMQGMNERNQPVLPATHPIPMQGMNERNQPVFPATHSVPMQDMNERNQPVLPAPHPIPMQGMNERNQEVLPAPHPIPMQGMNERNQAVLPAPHPIPMQGMNERNQSALPAPHPIPMQGMNERNQPALPAPHPNSVQDSDNVNHVSAPYSFPQGLVLDDFDCITAPIQDPAGLLSTDLEELPEGNVSSDSIVGEDPAWVDWHTTRDGCMSPHEFSDVLYDFLMKQSTKKRDKTLVHRLRYNLIYQILTTEGSRTQSAQFRYWCRKMFKVVPNENGQGKHLEHHQKQVCIIENLYAAITNAHVRINHAGRDRTSAAIHEEWEYVPKELTANYVKHCPTCQERRPAPQRLRGG